MGDGGMIPLSIISKRVVWSSCLNYGFLTGSMLIVTYYLPIYFQAVRNATPALSGVYLLPMIITMILSVIATGALRMSKSFHPGHSSKATAKHY